VDYSQCQLVNYNGGMFGGTSCWGVTSYPSLRGLAVLDMTGDGNLEYAFTALATTSGPDMLYVIDHGPLGTGAGLEEVLLEASPGPGVRPLPDRLEGELEDPPAEGGHPFRTGLGVRWIP